MRFKVVKNFQNKKCYIREEKFKSDLGLDFGMIIEFTDRNDAITVCNILNKEYKNRQS